MSAACETYAADRVPLIAYLGTGTPTDTTEASMSVPASAKDELIGAWKLVSFVVEDVTTKERKLLYGEHPKGYFMFLPSGRAAALITSDNRKVPTTAEESQAAFQSMIAFSGKYRVGEGKCIINVPFLNSPRRGGASHKAICTLNANPRLLNVK